MSAPELVGGMCDVHGDEHLREQSADDLLEALDSVVQCILMFGQYPQPERVPDIFDRDNQRPVEFSLVEFLIEHCDLLDVARIAAAALTDFGPEYSGRRLVDACRLEQNLRVHLADSDIVARRAAQMAEEALDISEERDV